MISLAILGAGRWGKHLIRNFLHQHRAQVVAIVDPVESHLTAVKTSHALPPDVQLLSQWQTLFTPGFQQSLETPLEAIVVATPAVTHREIIETALHHNLHVLAEKPLTLTVAESQTLTALAQQRGKQLMVDHTYLFHGAVQAGQQQVSRLGRVYYGYASRTNLGPVRLDVDALWDLAIHDLAILGAWLGEMPQTVMAWSGQWLPNGTLPDVVWGTMRYSSGVRVQGHWCWHNPDKQRRLALVGERGTLIFDELSPTPLVFQHGQVAATAEFPFVPTGLETEGIEFDREEPLATMCRHFLDCLESGQPSPISDGTVAAHLISPLVALSQSLHQGGAWVSL